MLRRERTKNYRKAGPSLDSLPVEILYKIMEYLKFKDIQALESTCVYLNRVSHARQFTSRAKLIFKDVLLEDYTSPIIYYLNSTKLYTEMTIQSCKFGLLDEFFDKYGEHITSLILKDLYMCDDQFIYILNSFPNLKTLRLYRIKFRFKYTPQNLEVPNILPELHQIHLQKCKHIHTIMKLIFRRTPYLKNLTIVDSEVANHKSKYADDELKQSALKISLLDRLSPTLRDLNVFLCSREYNDLIRLNHINLTKFTSPPSMNFDHKPFRFLCSQNNLIELDLSKLHTFTGFDISTLIDVLPMLEVLNLSRTRRTTNESITSLIHYQYLKKLDISQCINVNSYGLVAGLCSYRNETLTKNLPNLQELDMSNCGDGLKNKGLKSIFSNLKYLTHLFIAESPCITDDAITGSKSICGPNINDLKRLRVLDISGCQKITPRVCANFILPELVELNMAYYSYICLHSIKMLLKNCRSLEKLTLTGIDSSTRNHICAFPKYPKYLIDTIREKQTNEKYFCGHSCCVKPKTKRRRVQTSFYGVDE